MNKIITICFTIYILVSTSHIADGQDTIYVPQDYDTIQHAIDASVDGNIILVDTGIYYENINFKEKAITLTSKYIYNHDEFYRDYTIIDGSNPVYTYKASVVTFPFWSDTNSVICGFTITGGSGTLLGNRLGGGILCFDGGKIIHNKIVNNNVLADEHAFGGGIFAEGLTSSYFVIKNNIIENNQLENTSSSYMSWGAAIGIYLGNIIIKDNLIRENSTTGRPYGVGIYCSSCQGIVSHNIITNNVGYHSLLNKSRGGGMYLVNNESGLEITNNEITHNQLVWENGGGNFRYGGGIAVAQSGGFEYNDILIDKNIIKENSAKLGAGISVSEFYNIRISNNVIRDNEAEMDGGGIFLQNFSKGNENSGSINYSHNGDPMPEKKSLEKPLLVNNTIIYNHADFGGGIYSMMNEEEFIAFNNIIYENTATTMGPEAFIEGNCNGYFYNNNIDTNDIEGAGTWSGEDNIYGNPDFIDDSCHLTESSICLEKGADKVKVGGLDYFPPGYDMDDTLRPQNDYFDIGAYEIRFNNPGIDESESNTPHCKVYPNPASELISVLIQPGTEAKSIEIIDIQGKVVLHQEVKKSDFTVNISALSEGLYFVRIHTSEGIEVEKLVVR